MSFKTENTFREQFLRQNEIQAQIVSCVRLPSLARTHGLDERMKKKYNFVARFLKISEMTVPREASWLGEVGTFLHSSHLKLEWLSAPTFRLYISVFCCERGGDRLLLKS